MPPQGPGQCPRGTPMGVRSRVPTLLLAAAILAVVLAAAPWPSRGSHEEQEHELTHQQKEAGQATAQQALLAGLFATEVAAASVRAEPQAQLAEEHEVGVRDQQLEAEEEEVAVDEVVMVEGSEAAAAGADGAAARRLAQADGAAGHTGMKRKRKRAAAAVAAAAAVGRGGPDDEGPSKADDVTTRTGSRVRGSQAEAGSVDLDETLATATVVPRMQRPLVRQGGGDDDGDGADAAAGGARRKKKKKKKKFGGGFGKKKRAAGFGAGGGGGGDEAGGNIY